MMTEFTNIEDSESLARFILYSRWYRKEDKSVKSDAFIPYPHNELSVTRTKDLSENELMEIGKNIIHNSNRSVKPTLCGNAEFNVHEVRKINLDAIPALVKGNPNHSNVTGWPHEKSKQKSLAIELASKATLKLYL